MDLLTITLGVGVIGAAAFVDVRGLDWAHRRVSRRLQKEAVEAPMIREFPSSSHEIQLTEESRNAQI